MNPGVMPAPSGVVPSLRAGRVDVVICVNSSIVEAPFDGILRLRAMGSGGSGASTSTPATAPSGGNGGSFGYKEVLVRKGDKITVTLGAGGAAANGTVGNQGGTTTITGPNGLNAAIPGGNGGVYGVGLQPADNAAPTGFDQYWLGGLGGKASALFGGGGGSAPILNGVAKGYEGGDGGPSGSAGWGGGAGVGGDGGDGTSSFPGTGGGAGGPGFNTATTQAASRNLALIRSTSPGVASDSHSRLLINVSAGGGGTSSGTNGSDGGPGGGGGAASGTSTAGGNGGFGSGGGAGHSGSSTYCNGGPGGGGGSINSSAAVAGSGGNAVVTLEFVEKL